MSQTIDPTPKTDTEQHASARAVIEERRLAEHDALVDALTDRERLFIERAWEAGARETRDRILKALANPHAATLDAKAVAATVNSLKGLPVVFEQEKWTMQPHHDHRIVSLVRSATRELERR